MWGNIVVQLTITTSLSKWNHKHQDVINTVNSQLDKQSLQ